MKITHSVCSSLFGLYLLSSACLFGGEVSARIVWQRTPGEGIQPQAVTDREGNIHLLYFKGDPKAGDLFYTRWSREQESFSDPIRVNQQAGSAVAIGTIRGGQLAVGKGGRIHVVWNGSGKVTPDGDYMKAPLLYARSNHERSAFEPEKNVITRAWGLDGGSSVAADDQGRVYVTWHASAPGNQKGEAGRAVFLARSMDEGASFESEIQASPAGSGACACCGMKSFADSQGRIWILFRAAREATHRDEMLLLSENAGQNFQEIYAHPWPVNACPMSSASLTETDGIPLAAWETQSQVYWARLDPDPKASRLLELISPPGQGRRKYPVAVGNKRGETLLVWAEDTGWNRGGALAWQIFDEQNRPTAEHGRKDGIPVWGLPTAAILADGGFLVVY